MSFRIWKGNGLERTAEDDRELIKLTSPIPCSVPSPDLWRKQLIQTDGTFLHCTGPDLSLPLVSS